MPRGATGARTARHWTPGPRFAGRAFALVLGLCAVLPAHADWRSSVVRLDVVRADGSVSRGSAVRIGATRLLTSCHVIRDAKTIEMSQGARRSRDLRVAAGDAYRDLCLLDAPQPLGEVALPAPADAMKAGMPVIAAGYGGGEFSTSTGTVKGLHPCPCDGGDVIQTTAGFEVGASGGGLFDTAGRLIGILTFKSLHGGDYHFAVPVAWYRLAERQPLDALGPRQAFWQNPNGSLFLMACALGAEQDWQGLHDLAQDWIEAEPRNPEPWAALGRAERGLGRRHQALHAFRKALEIDSAHQEVRWEVQKLEFDLGLEPSL